MDMDVAMSAEKGTTKTDFRSETLVNVIPENEIKEILSLKNRSSSLPLCKYLGSEMDGAWENNWWYPTKCRLKQYSSSEAKQCFKGKSIAIIGDSTAHAIWRVCLFLLITVF